MERAPIEDGDLQPFRDDLRRWFVTHRRDLPWRNTRDPYRIWVSEVMLQQTRVTTVVPYYERFVEKYPDILTLATADPQAVLKSWERLGYYARARNLQRAARKVMDEFGGVIPRDPEAMRKLPGVGDYIASAVQSIAFGRPLPVLDGNVRRVLARLFLIETPIDTAASRKRFESCARLLLDHRHPGEFNQAMMELGATICRPRQPKCGECPVARYCRAFLSGAQAAYPVRVPHRPVPRYHIAVGIVHKEGRILITQRRPEGLLGGLWEFPGGKVRRGESAEAACRREIKEEVNLNVRVTDYLTHVDHAYTHFKIAVDVYSCVYEAGEVRLKGPIDFRWILVDEIDRFPFPSANHKIIPALKEKKT